MRTHTIDLRVRYGETDQMGIVYNAEMLTYFEVARTEYLRARGTTYRSLEERGVLLAVSEAHCKYLGPARYDDEIEIVTWVDRLRGTRIDFGHHIALKDTGDPVAEGRMVLACLNRNMRPRKLPPEVADLLEVWPGGPER
jgi:acyl-CoA thioester hydrolase